jgi:hypothetical protein
MSNSLTLKKIHDEFLIFCNKIIHEKEARISLIIILTDAFLIVSLLMACLEYFFVPITNHIQWYEKTKGYDNLIVIAATIGSASPFLLIPRWFQIYISKYNEKLWRYLLR